MNSRLSLALLVALSGGVITSCNSDDSQYEVIEDTTVSNVSLTAFSLEQNSKVAANLDSLFFTVDLNKGRVFNADSLPVGTKVGNLIVKITHPTMSKVELVFKDEKGEQKTVDYLENPNDSIYFGNGTVTLRMVSASGSVMREYGVDVNVHKVKPDSLWWDADKAFSLPTSLSSPTAQRTIKKGDIFYTLAGDGAAYTLSTSSSLSSGEWETAVVNLPADADVNSFTATTDSFYIIAGGKLYSSSDASDWTSTDAEMTYIYGAYMDKVVGVTHADDDSYVYVTYPGEATSPVSPECPVSGTSEAIVYTSEWSANPMLFFTGGRKADGSLTGDTWAFDGNQWACISINPIPALEGVSVTPYYNMSITNQWIEVFTPVLLAFGGNDAAGKINTTVYMSPDRGVHWAIAPDFMQSTTLPAITSAQVIGYTQTLSDTPLSRAIRPITEWNCDYLYIFGGSDAAGKFNQNVWRGALNAFRIKPIQ